MVSHLASLWKWDFLELGNGLLFEGFWRITRKTKRENQGKKTVRIFMWNAPSSAGWYTILLKRSEFRRAELNSAFKALLILMTSISESMFACF